MGARETKSVNFRARLTPSEYAIMQGVAQRYDGNLSQAFVAMIREAGRGTSAQRRAAMGETKSPVLTDQGAHRAFQG